MQVFPTKTPAFVKALFPQFIWHISTEEPVLYLSFDDGPTPEITEWVLNCLSQYKAKATFFCIGNNIEQYPHIFKEVVSQGHVVGNHSHQHLKGWNTKTETYISDINKAQEQMPLVNANKLFRPPYGKMKISQAKQLLAEGYQPIFWDVLSYDWDKHTSPEKCLENIRSTAGPGSIVVMHDSLKASKNLMYALPRVLEHFSALGYRFKGLEL